MGESTAQTVREIEQLRDGIGQKLEVLEERLPQPAVLARRVAGVAFGGGLGGSVFWFAVRKIRGGKRNRPGERRIEARIEVLPPGVAKALERSLQDGSFRTVGTVVAFAWAVMRFAELRQLRKMNRALIASRA